MLSISLPCFQCCLLASVMCKFSGCVFCILHPIARRWAAHRWLIAGHFEWVWFHHGDPASTGGLLGTALPPQSATNALPSSRLACAAQPAVAGPLAGHHASPKRMAVGVLTPQSTKQTDKQTDRQMCRFSGCVFCILHPIACRWAAHRWLRSRGSLRKARPRKTVA